MDINIFVPGKGVICRVITQAVPKGIVPVKLVKLVWQYAPDKWYAVPYEIPRSPFGGSFPRETDYPYCDSSFVTILKPDLQEDKLPVFGSL